MGDEGCHRIYTDNRSLYDLLYKGHGVPQDKRTCIEVLSMRQVLQEQGVEPRWLETWMMPADGMTKVLTKTGALEWLLQGNDPNKFVKR